MKEKVLVFLQLIYFEQKCERTVWTQKCEHIVLDS